MWLGILLLAIRPAALFAQEVPKFRTGQLAPILDPPPESNPSGAGFTGTEGLTTIPPDSHAFQPEPPAITPNSFFRNTQFPYNAAVTPPPIGPNVNTESVTGQFKLTLPLLEGGIPLFEQNAFQPQDANLKIGPFYFKLREAEAAFLYSDNINLTPVGQSGEIAYLGLTIDILAQITENLRLATEGTFIYLPIQNEAGIAGFGLTDFFDFGLVAGPLAHAQISWDTQIGSWHVVFGDDFEILGGVYSNDFRSDDVLFSGFNTNDQAVTGRYVLEPEEGSIYQNQGINNQNQQINFRNDLVVYSNTLSAATDRLLPGTVRLTARIYDQNLWYNQGNRGLPELRQDGVTVSLVSERENMRFKPYLIYNAFSTNEFSGVQSIIQLGVTGPITDQLHLLAEVGYFSGGLQDSGALWRFELTHEAGPYTQESFIWAREFNNFHDEIDEFIGYDIEQILGPKLEADAYAYRSLDQYSFEDSTQASEDQWRFGLRLTYTMGPKTCLRVTGEYGTFDPGGTTYWTGRAELSYNFTDTLLLHFVYQYQQSRSQLTDWNYQENLFFLSLTKYFE